MDGNFRKYGRDTRPVTRRTLLRLAMGAASVAGAAVLGACGGSAVVAPTVGSTPAAATVAKPTIAATAAGATAAAPVSTVASVSTSASVAPTAASAMGATAAPATVATAGPALMGAPVAAASGKIPSPNPDLGVPDAYTKLTPPFPKSVPMIPGKGGKVTAFLINYDPPVPPKSDNLYWQELEKRLGVTCDATMVDSSGYEQKFAATLAGGDIPDLTFFSPPPGYEKILLQGAFTDLTEYLTGSALKDYPNLAAFPSVLWKNVALNKKIYGVPRPRLLGSNSFYFRQDWAEKTGHGCKRTRTTCSTCL